MTIIGFNFNKIDVERKKALEGKVSVNNNVSIKNVEESDLELGKEKQKALKFTFEFKSEYTPDMGGIILTGDLLFVEETKKITEILSGWRKDKKIAPDIMSNILNTILTRGNVLSLTLSQNVNLPPPFPLPRVNVKGQKPA